MAVLDPPGALPGLARAVIAHLWRQPERAEALTQLQALFVPSSLGADGLGETLTVLRSVGLLRDGTDPVRLSETAVGLIDETDAAESSFPRIIRRALLDSRRDGDPWVFKGKNPNSEGGRDFARASTWFLAQDALAQPLGWTTAGETNADVVRQRGLPSTVPRAIQNTTRWGAFRRWAQYTGLGRAVVQGGAELLMPEPSRAVQEELQFALTSEPQPLAAVLERLASRLPCMAGGAFRRALDQRLEAPLSPAALQGALDTTISQSLLALRDARDITLEYLSDAEGVVTFVDDANVETRWSHVRWAGPER